jgi:NAD(P)-dependent dehydrogenase (short-subunit alcohol dehydrogenase family)
LDEQSPRILIGRSVEKNDRSLLSSSLLVMNPALQAACYLHRHLSQQTHHEEKYMAYTIDLSGRVALVTGASSGLGTQFAKTLAQAGAAVVLAGRRVERLKTLRAEIEAAGGDAHVVRLDVTDPDSIKAAVAHAETETGAIDILVNNSGVSTTQKLTDVTPEDYDYVMDTNTKGAFFVAQEVGKRMLARAKGSAPGTYTGGRIVNIASMAGLKALGQIGVYCMSKAAVIHMTRAMALEWGRYGINVNAICPGYIDTEINHHHWATEQGQKLINMMPRKRIGAPQDLDVVLTMLCSNESHFVNGAVIQADDGFAI